MVWLLVWFASTLAQHLILSIILFYCLHSLIAMPSVMSVWLLYPGFSPILIIALNLIYVSDYHTVDFVIDCSVPKGSVLGPLLFISYTAEVVEVFNRHAVQFHLFADDKQYVSGWMSEVDDIHRQLADWADDVAVWYASHARSPADRLQLNAGKTELIWFGMTYESEKTIQPWTVCKNLFRG